MAEFYQSVSVNGPRMICGDLNSRLYFRQSDEDCIESYYFQNSCQHLSSDMNRFLLVEFCTAGKMQMGNTFFNVDPERLVTYFEIGQHVNSEISSTNFAQLDLILIEEAWFAKNIEH